MTAKTKRDRAAGRRHRHTATQTIINNHQGIIDDIASIDNNIAALQDRTCDLGLRLDNWYDRLEERTEKRSAERRLHHAARRQERTQTSRS